MTLFIDVDDTLVLWLTRDSAEGPHPYGAGAQGWARNQALLDAVERWRVSRPLEAVVVWSGGGREYAERWRDQLMPEAEHALNKDIRLPGPADVCVDDQYLKVSAQLLTWQEFVEDD